MSTVYCVYVYIRYKDGTELSADDDRLSILSDGDKHSLTINKTTMPDAGEYKITAANDNSRLSCSASLLVVGMTFFD